MAICSDWIAVRRWKQQEQYCTSCDKLHAGGCFLCTGGYLFERSCSQCRPYLRCCVCLSVPAACRLPNVSRSLRTCPHGHADMHTWLPALCNLTVPVLFNKCLTRPLQILQHLFGLKLVQSALGNVHAAA